MASTRPSILEREPIWSAAGDGKHRLDLDGLSGGSAEALVHALVGDAVPAPLVARIAEASDGNCLFIEELLRTWVSVGILVREGSDWRMTSVSEAVTLPATVHAVYGAQLDDLPPPARSAARRAAVAGRRFPVDALSELGVVEPAEALASLDRRSLIAGPTELPVIGAGYTYRHALLRDAAYASLARAERAVLHVALARWLETAAGTHVDEVAESIGGHYETALRSVPALASTVSAGLDRAAASALAAEWLERAAGHVVRQAANDAGSALLRRAIELTPDDAPLDAARRWLSLGRTLRREGLADAAVDALDRSLTIARDVFASSSPKSPGWLGGSVCRGAGWGPPCHKYFEQLRFLDTWHLADRLLEEIGPAEDVESATLVLARARGRAGETNESQQWVADSTAALAIVRATGDRGLELETLVEVAGAPGRGWVRGAR